MTIEVKIKIEAVAACGNEFGVGVLVEGHVRPEAVSDAEGATLIGICMAINRYMHSRGAEDFNCLRGLLPGGREEIWR